MLIAVIGLLALGTYSFRLAGVLMHGRLRLPAPLARALPLAAMALLGALIATSALTQSGGFAGWARPAGVLAGFVAALCRAPFIAVVVIAAATTALLRLAGVA